MPDDTAPLKRRSIFDLSFALVATVVTVCAAYVYWRDGGARFVEILLGDLGLFAGILPKVLAGCLIAVFIMVLLPRERVARLVGAESGFSGLLIATLAGAIIPGGPFAIYPIAGAFMALGADAAAAAAFITSWTLLGYNRALIWEMPFFGAEFVGWRMLAAIPFPIFVGIAARLALRAWTSRKKPAVTDDDE